MNSKDKFEFDFKFNDKRITRLRVENFDSIERTIKELKKKFG